MCVAPIEFRRLRVALAMPLLLAAGWANAACDNIAALSLGRAEYMVLDPATLATLRVGDLRWLGVGSVDFVAPGSTFEQSSLNSYAFLRVNSGEPVIKPHPSAWGRGLVSDFTLLSLENMGEGLRSQDEIPFMGSGAIIQSAEPLAVWSDWIQENTLLREDYNTEQHSVAGYDLLDPKFNVLRRWEPKVGYGLQWPSCVVDNNIYFAGRFAGEVRVHVFDEQGEGTIYQLESLERENLRLVPLHAKNCKAVAFRDTADENPVRGAVLVDIVTGSIGPEFTVRKFSEFVLYDDGKRLLQQNMNSRFLFTSGGASYMERATPTNQFNLIDTTTGDVLLERTLETGSGVLSNEMLCDEEAPLALVKDADVFYLIDPNTLEIVASKAVPKLWNGVYDVFE